jgi:uncharacterized protein involved in exopolysaccharide biosynthesis
MDGPSSLLDLTWRARKGIAASAFAVALIAYGAAWLMSPAYRAEIVVSPLGDSSRSDLMMAVGSQIGGLGALAGFGIGGDAGRNEQLATLTSRELAGRFIDAQGLVGQFCDARVVECGEGAAGAGPSERQRNDTLKKFRRRVLTVKEDKRTGLVHISVTWFDRGVAARWANDYVALANSVLLARSISESDRRVAFLRTAADKAETVELRAAVYNLMESEIKSRMVASSSIDYAFKVVDPATAPDVRDRVRPKRALMAVLGALLGAVAGATVLLLRAKRRASGDPPHAGS